MLRSVSRWASAALLAAAPTLALAQQPPAPAPAADKPFSDVPPIQPVPRLGWFPILPSGPGYYSLLDQVQDHCREKPPKYGYPRFGIMSNSFFDADWKYLDDPKNTDHDFFDCLKRQKCCDWLMFTTGGELRYRYNSENNSRLFNGDPAANRGKDNTYDLTRLRIYGDLWLTDNFRVYAEYIDAQGFHNDLPWLPIDRNWGDLLNAFVDVRTLTIAEQPVWLRVGRQELTYGSQRLISPLDWANTRRTFEGVKAFWKNEHLSVDAFVVEPVLPNNRQFDSADHDQLFSGLWLTYRPDAHEAVDAYALNLNRQFNPQAIGGFREAGASNVTTLGTRYHGDRCNWLWDVELMGQVGRYNDQPLLAYATTVAGGYHFKDAPAAPVFWVSYDHASGDPSPGGTRRTFDQLFPFGHYYFGYIDVVGRRNIHDLSLSMTAYPAPWITATAQLHNFYLDRKTDALYNAGGIAIRQDATGRSGRNVGQEVDLLTNFHLTAHQDILISYSYLFAGEFVRNTAKSPAGRNSPDALYVQYTLRW